MTLEYRCSNCGTLLQTTNADPLHDEIERLRSQLEKAKAALKEIEFIGERSPTFSAAIRPGNIAHAALISLSDDQQKPMPKGPAGDPGQVGWMGGEFDR